jgi:hypothetical protein
MIVKLKWVGKWVGKSQKASFFRFSKEMVYDIIPSMNWRYVFVLEFLAYFPRGR